MASVSSHRVVLLFSVLLYPASTTRFLPSVIWDNVNTLLCCPYNWLVIPNIDLHDIIDFVCPTSKLVVKQVNYQTRTDESMNFNLFKREWKGSVQDLQRSISNGSIHSFCNTSNSDNVKLYTCRDGKYNSFPVKFTHFIFDQSRLKYDKYEKDKTYVFYSNGDGSVSSLKSKRAKCSMFFAVHVTKDNRQFDVTYGKQAVTSKCKCDTSMKPTLIPTTIPQESTTSTPTPTTLSSSTTTQKSEETTSTLPSTPPSTLPSSPTTRSETSTEEVISVTRLQNIATTEKQRTSPDTSRETECKKIWVSIPIFIAVVIASFIAGILGAVLFFQVLRRQPAKKDGYNNALYRSHRGEREVTTPEDTISEPPEF